MAKSKTALLSLGSQGSIGGSVTTQKLRQQTMIRSKPFPKQPDTLAQIYQRWLYQDYIAWWHTLTAAQQRQWHSNASRHYMTGFAYWMSRRLKLLPDIAAWWKLDEKSGIIAHDSSKYATHGTIFGATPTTGLIDGAYYFTLDDFIEATTPQLNFTSGDFSLITWIKLDVLNPFQVIFARGLNFNDGYELQILANGRIYIRTNQAATRQITQSSLGDIVPGIAYTIGFSRKGASIRLYKDGLDVTALPDVHLDPLTCNRTVKIGIYDDKVSAPFPGIIDNVIMFSRELSPTDHMRWAQRRYP